MLARLFHDTPLEEKDITSFEEIKHFNKMYNYSTCTIEDSNLHILFSFKNLNTSLHAYDKQNRMCQCMT